jgi:hypothetical protein
MSSFAGPAGPPPSNTLTGARCSFQINGVQLGFASNVSWSRSINYAPLQVLGNIEVVSHIPQSYTATLTCNNFYLLGTTLVTYGFMAKVGNSAQEHFANITALNELTAVVEDIQSQTIIAICEGCRAESSSIQVSQGNYMSEDVNFVVRRIADVAG